MQDSRSDLGPALGSTGLKFSASWIVIPVYIAALALAEALALYDAVFYGFFYHTILLAILLGHYVLMDPAPYRRLLPALALIPILRILSLVMPVKFIPEIYWYGLIGIPLLLAIALTAKLLHISRAQLGLRLGRWPVQLLIAASGLPLSLAAFLLLRPTPIMRLSETDAPHLAVSVLILVIFAGFTEELLFRGLLQHVAGELFGAASIIVSSLLFALVYLGSLSFNYILFIAFVGLFFGWCARRSRSIVGVALAHSLITIVLAFRWPLTKEQVASGQLDSLTTMLQFGLWILAAVGVGFIVLALLRMLVRAARSFGTPARAD